MLRRRSGDCLSMRLRDVKRELIRRYLEEGKRPAEIRKPEAPVRCGERPPPVASLGPVATAREMKRESAVHDRGE